MRSALLLLAGTGNISRYTISMCCSDVSGERTSKVGSMDVILTLTYVSLCAAYMPSDIPEWKTFDASIEVDLPFCKQLLA